LLDFLKKSQKSLDFGIVPNNIIINNTAIDNGVGIYLDGSSNNILKNNTVLNNKYGIYLVDDSNNNYLDGNTASSNDYGIYQVFSNNNTLSGNNVSFNKVFGLYLSDASNNNIYNNIFKNDKNFMSGTILRTTGILPKLQALTLLEVLTLVAIFGWIQWALASVKYVQITTAMEYAIHLMIFRILIILTTCHLHLYLQ
jgi:parallel beta-helix repeat protein